MKIEQGCWGNVREMLLLFWVKKQKKIHTCRGRIEFFQSFIMQKYL